MLNMNSDNKVIELFGNLNIIKMTHTLTIFILVNIFGIWPQYIFIGNFGKMTR